LRRAKAQVKRAVLNVGRYFRTTSFKSKQRVLMMFGRSQVLYQFTPLLET
jgi:hypothetical protein